MKSTTRCLILLSLTGLVAFGTEPKKKAATIDKSWVGIYTSPAEIGGFAGTKLSIEVDGDERLRHRTISHSDVVSSDAIEQAVAHGQVLTDGDKVYVPEAYGYYSDGKPSLGAMLTRYTRLQIQGRTVLMRDDALKAFREQNRLYDYGILIKVAESGETLSKLDTAKHESIKVLYKDPKQKWKDPFVHGPNKR